MDCLHPGIEIIIGATTVSMMIPSSVFFVGLVLGSGFAGIVTCMILDDFLRFIRTYRAPREKSKRLLLAHLNDTQKIDFKQVGYFFVMGGKTKYCYRINCNSGVLGNITCLFNGAMMCVYVPDVPKYDCFLAQKLLLECAETEDYIRNTAHYG